MSALRDMAHAAARAVAHPVLPDERLLATERVAAALARKRLRKATVAAMPATAAEVAALGNRDLARLAERVWADRRRDAVAGAVLLAIAAGRGRACDRAIIAAYLRHRPVGHPLFEPLRQVATAAAARHDWAWRARADLFRPE